MNLKAQLCIDLDSSACNYEIKLSYSFAFMKRFIVRFKVVLLLIMDRLSLKIDSYFSSNIVEPLSIVPKSLASFATYSYMT
jgi:hypothetical protein